MSSRCSRACCSSPALIARFRRASPAERILITPVIGASGAASRSTGWDCSGGRSPGSAASRLTHETLTPDLGRSHRSRGRGVVGAGARSRPHAGGRRASWPTSSAAARPGRLRNELARITHDDSLEIVVPARGSGRRRRRATDRRSAPVRRVTGCVESRSPWAGRSRRSLCSRIDPGSSTTSSSVML